MDVTHYIRVYDNTLANDVCDNLVQFFENNIDNQRKHIRQEYNPMPDSSWRELNLVNYMSNEGHNEFVNILKRYKSIYEDDTGLSPRLPYSGKLSDLRIKKYAVNGKDRFQAHYDAAEEMSNRYLVFLWYLNDVEEGGETEFVDLGMSVSPKKGRLVIFPPYWMYRHEAKIAISNPKYIINTFLLW